MQTQVLSDNDNKVRRTRWDIRNKCDSQMPDARARLVARVIKTYRCDAVFASTPSLEAERIVLSQRATERKTQPGEAPEASFIGIRKAYIHCLPERALHLFMPRRTGL